MKLISEDTNYKNILQVQIQKEFKCTPTYLILNEDDETGYTMGVYLAKNIQVQNIKPEYADDYENTMVSFAILHERLEQDGKVFVKLAESAHKIKKKAEQEACMLALDKLLRG
jgi:dsRNA-specific ribonuclease